MGRVIREVFFSTASAKWLALVVALLVWSGAPAPALAQGVTVTTLAGMAGVAGTADGTGGAARFDGPLGVACDAAGNVYVADTLNNSIRRITPAGVVTTLAGAAAGLDAPGGVACDAAGSVYVADTWNHVIRKIAPAGDVSILAGALGEQGSDDGSRDAARFSYPGGVACDGAGNVYVADAGNNSIRKVTPAGQVSTLVGADAGLDSPGGVACGAGGSVYVADTFNDTICKVTSAGVVTTLLGADAGLDSPGGVACDAAGNVYVADTYDHVVLSISSAGAVSILAGAVGVPGSVDGSADRARFDYPGGVACAAGGTVYVADTSNDTIRSVAVDALPPLTTAAPPLAGSATSGWVNHAQTVTLTATDVGSGVAATSYSIDGGPTLTYSGPFTVSAPGSHAVTYFSTDKSGNVEPPQTGYVNIDAGVPTTKAQPAGVRAGRTVTLRFSVADPAVTCGSATVRIQIRKGSRVVRTIIVGWKATNTAIACRYKAALKKGSYTWRVLAIDAAGNKAVDMPSARLTVK